jgi:thiol:disulfide interchange protein
MNKYVVLGLTLFLSIVVFGQESTVDPVTWSQKFSKSEVEIGETIEVIFTAPLKPHHHIYSNDFAADCPPQKAKFDFTATDLEVIGNPKPIGTHRYVDDVFDCEVSDFQDKAEFRQKVKITGSKPSLGGKLHYQICNDRGCLSYKHKFSLNSIKVKAKLATPVITEPVNGSEPNEIQEEAGTDTTIEIKESETIPAVESEEIVEDTEVSGEKKNDLKSMSLWALFLLGVGGGLLALVTPCVFPMIPMTVAFFTKETDRKKGIMKALFYGASIVGIYLILGLILAKVFDEKFTYMLSTHWLPNMIFFGIFVFFSLSFFGMFELTLPSSFVNKMDAKGDKGGYIGIFFIAFTLVLVSFSCTVPIVGSVSILAAGGATIRPLVAMLGFALTFALPFVLFAIFPAWLNGLPKSGGWLNSVKVVLGFVELALALKFFSQADLVYSWGILDRDVFIAIWVVLSMLMGLYLLGKIKFPHDSDLPRVPVLRFLFAVVVFSFGLWMLPGMWGAPLKPLAGLLPPLTTQDYVVSNGGAVTSHSSQSDIRFANELHAPLGLTGYFTMKDAIVAAKKTGKPIFVDFTGKSCANCRKMEENVWPDPRVLTRLQNDFIVANLYCDVYNMELPKEEWVKDKDGDVIKSIGEVNQQLQLDHFKSFGQPWYYVVDANMKVLSEFPGYKNDAPAYIKFLDAGKAAFESRK